MVLANFVFRNDLGSDLHLSLTQIRQLSLKWTSKELNSWVEYPEMNTQEVKNHRIFNNQINFSNKTKQKPFFSIILTFHNTQRIPFLRRALESLLTLEFDNWECILIDQSSESSLVLALISELSDSRINHVPFERHSAPHARNYGMSLAKGDFITFLDDDNYYLPWRLDLLASIFRKDKNLDVVYTGLLVHNSLKRSWKFHYSPFDPESLRKINPADTNSICLSRNFLPSISWDTNMQGCQDWCFLANASFKTHLFRSVPDFSVAISDDAPGRIAYTYDLKTEKDKIVKKIESFLSMENSYKI